MPKKPKKKYYVVWSGKQPGVFSTWEDCKRQVHGVPGSRFRSYPTEEEAKQAYESGGPNSRIRDTKAIPKHKAQLDIFSNDVQSINFEEESISVDAACSGNPGIMEYQGVYTKNGKQIFHFGPIDHATNNIGEFLAIVHALALLKQKQSNLPIYSDSLTAISWVRNKKANTNIEQNASTKRLWLLIRRAEIWLQTNEYPNKIIKWETKVWGEIKADFGRKG
ncbi:Ribonuclease H [Bacillus sp. THAF10]|uniref:ribonuclease H1 domain-containing protein n=1 Tax=Bacillus sp. THAF10 TaxID=2587848 RepID=UPI00126911EC|nr:ribonuclease H family protein [Bacillus sp. THAF10]QFT87678.1 Ribonuclease H [Bacillus sp. THAF10]